MKLSVVVPVHNGGAELRTCLQALMNSRRKADEVLVIDDGSTDGTIACAEAFSTKVIRLEGPPHGPAFARNRGAKKAKGDVLVFIDADVVVHPETLGGFERVFLDQPTVAAVFGSYDDQPPGLSRVSRFKNLLHHYVHQHGMREAETFWAGCGAVRRDVYLSFDGFSESYGRPSIEDIELGVRLREAGHRILLCPEILCTHLKRWTLRSLVCTDIFSRAVPWTRLILQLGQLPSGLNTDGKSRWSALLAWLLVFGILGHLISFAVGWRWGAVSMAGACLGCGLILSLLNAPLYRFFFQHGDKRFGLTAVALHGFYLLYSSLIFGCMLGLHRLKGIVGMKKAGNDDAPAEKVVRPFRQNALVGGLVSFVLFAIYVGDRSPLPGNDATPNTHLAATLLSKGALSFTPEDQPFMFRWTLLRRGSPQTIIIRSWDESIDGKTMRELLRLGLLNTPTPSYYLARTSKPGVYANSYGVATGLFALPFIASVYPFMDSLPERTQLLWLLCKLAAAFAVAGSAWFLFVVAADHMRLSTAVLLTLIYGLGTSVWCLSSQTLWQHGPGEFFLAMGTFFLFRRNRDYGSYLTGFAYGMAFLCRPTNSMAVLVGFVFFLLTDWRKSFHFLAGGLPVALIFFAYNLHFFDKLIVFGQVNALAERHGSLDSSVYWKNSFLTGLAGILISPSRGLFVFSPTALVSLWAGFRSWKDRRWLPLRAIFLTTLALWLIGACWAGWWGGWSYGYRLIVDSTTLLAFLAIPVAEEVRKRHWVRMIVIGLTIWSVSIQVLGIYAYDVKGWNGLEGYEAILPGQASPPWFKTSEEADKFCQPVGCSYRRVVMDVDKRRFRSRLWSVKDNQILYYLSNLKKSRLMRFVYLRQFLSREG
jgi:hypothetical protein